MVLAQTPKRRPTPQEKKRHGHHHKHTKHYEKTYWPYLPLLLIVIVALIGNTWLSRRSQVLGAQSTVQANSLLQATNEQRNEQHEAPLHLSSQLAAAAQAKANDMTARDYWSHDTPDGKTPWTFIQQAGYRYQLAGENLAYGFSTDNAAVAGWMNSAEHRANILNAAYSDVGFGVANSADFQGDGPQTIIVAMYAEAANGAAPMAVLGTQTALPAGQQVSRIQTITGGMEPWSLAAASFLAGGCLVFFIVRHGLLLRRAFVYSEAFIIKHPALDAAVVSLGCLSFLLTRTVGFIH